MNKPFSKNGSWVTWLFIVLLAIGSYSLATGKATLLTPDQRGHRLLEQGDFAEASIRFADPMWRGVALFRLGEFAEAAGVFAGMDTADAAFNQGNALVMQGQYDAAAARYARALELRPGWQDATTNRDIALARAAMLKQEGGDMTGGMLGADDIVFTKNKPPPGAGEEQTEGGEATSDKEMRAIWLRQVQTKPADFLAAKFAYQQAIGPAPGDEQEATQ